MQRVQVFLQDEQCEALGKLSRISGVAKSDLIRQGVDLLLKNRQQQQADWKEAARQVRGIWKDHQTLEETQQQIRQSLNTRLSGNRE